MCGYNQVISLLKMRVNCWVFPMRMQSFSFTPLCSLKTLRDLIPVFSSADVHDAGGTLSLDGYAYVHRIRGYYTKPMLGPLRLNNRHLKIQNI